VTFNLPDLIGTYGYAATFLGALFEGETPQLRPLRELVVRTAGARSREAAGEGLSKAVQPWNSRTALVGRS
jgi:hypothetical protein